MQYAIVDLPGAMQPQELRTPGRVGFQHEIEVCLQSRLVLRLVAARSIDLAIPGSWFIATRLAFCSE